MTSLKVAVPEISIEEVMLNETNPFKRKMRWTRLRCRECNEVILGRAVSKQSDWEIIRKHLKLRHSINVDDGVPIRLLSLPLFRSWFKRQKKEPLDK